MFTRIFGKPKPETNALTTLDKLNETLEMLEKKEKVLLKKASAEVEKAKEFTRAKNKSPRLPHHSSPAHSGSTTANMGFGSGLALKSVQLFIRSIQLTCGVVILAIYSYILATLNNHKLSIGNSVRAVEGIAGFACLYAISAIIFVCCFAGRTLPSFLGILLDTAFIVCFIYVAAANKTGAGSCSGELSTPFGTGKAGDKAKGSGGFTTIPTYRSACKLQTACLAVAIIAIFFYCFSFLTTVGLARNHYKERRLGPGGDGQYPGGNEQQGFLNGLFRRNTVRPVNPDNRLPEHPHPNHMSDSRESHGTESTAVGEHDDNANNKYAKLELFLLIAALVSLGTTEARKANVTRIQFYMHDVVGGPNPTAVRVAGRSSNTSGSDPIGSVFGSIYMMDNPLTATHSPNSTLLGRAQGLYAMSSQRDEFSLLMTLTYSFVSGRYNGSSFSVLGRNPVMKEVREMPVVGGTGIFRLARGYCLAKTHSTYQMDAVIGYNVTLIHY